MLHFAPLAPCAGPVRPNILAFSIVLALLPGAARAAVDALLTVPIGAMAAQLSAVDLQLDRASF